MSRNDGRMGLPDNLVFDHDPTEQNTPAPDYSAKENMTWALPTEFVSLPSQGLFYPEGHPLHLRKSIEIKYMTAHEEDLLTSESLIKKGIAVDRAVRSVMIDKSIPFDDLLVADKNALVTATRITGYGPEYDTQVQCPSCGVQSDFTFNLELSEYEDTDPMEPLRDLGISLTENKTFLVKLPFSGQTVECRFLTGKEQEKIGKLKLKKNKVPTLESNTTDLLKSIIVSADGETDRFALTALIKNMPARDSKHLRTIVDKVSPKHLFESEFECPSCGVTADVEVPLSVRFFWPNAKI